MSENISRPSGKVPVAIVYWGRRGAGGALMSQIVEHLGADGRFDLYISASLQSETRIAFNPARDFSVETFSGPVSLVWRTLLSPLTCDRLVRRLSAAGVRAIVTVMPHLWGLVLLRAARKAGMRTVLMVHDSEPHPGERRPVFDWLASAEIRASDRIVTLSNHVADRLIVRGDAAEGDITGLFHPILSFGAARTAPSPDPDHFRLLFFGRILPYKGVPLLLEAFSLLRAAGARCTLRIVGRGRIDAAPKLLAQPGLTIDEGWVAPDAIGEILASADAVMLPYVEASQSGVIAAAYGAGLPVVATPVGGLAEQVIEGETGTLAASPTAAAFAQAIGRLIDRPDLYAACQVGIPRFVSRHAPERFATALGDAILSALNRPARRSARRAE